MVEQDVQEGLVEGEQVLITPAPTRHPMKGGHRTDVCRAFKAGASATVPVGDPHHPATCQRCGQPFSEHGPVPLCRDGGGQANAPLWTSVLVSKVMEPGTYAETLGFGYTEAGEQVAFEGDAEAMKTISRWLEWVQQANASRGVHWPLLVFVRRADIVVEATDANRLTSAVYVGPGVRPLPDREPLLKTGQGLIVFNIAERQQPKGKPGYRDVMHGWADPLDPYAPEDWGDMKITDIPIIDLIVNSNWRTRAR